MYRQPTYRMWIVLLSVVAVIALAACAAGPNELGGTADADGKTAGFWLGLWHGFIAPFAFIVSLFSKAVNVYEAHNNGGWYNFGYIMGLSAIFGGGGHGGARIGRRRNRGDGGYRRTAAPKEYDEET